MTNTFSTLHLLQVVKILYFHLLMLNTYNTFCLYNVYLYFVYITLVGMKISPATIPTDSYVKLPKSEYDSHLSATIFERSLSPMFITVH